MNENLKWIAAAVAVVGVTVGGILYLSRAKKAPPTEAPVAVAPAPEPVAEEPAIRHPLPETEAAPAAPELPALDDSDVPMVAALTELIGADPAKEFLVPQALVRHIVVTVDNLPEQKVAERLRPSRRAPGDFIVSGSEDAPVLDPANFERYERMVQAFRSMDTPRLVATYTRYYPLFQEAYANLGHPPQYFNDRVIEVIDHLLAAPEVPGPIALARPGVLYEYADPQLEALSAGQKVMIRMGGENARAVKAKLTELRAALAANPRR